METSIVDLLVNGSPMAAFAVFLIYLYKTQQARMDTLVERFQSQQEKIRQEYKTDVAELRSRYDNVIETQNTERSRIKDNIEDHLKGLNGNVSNIHSTCQAMVISLEINKEQVANLAISIDATLNAIKEMQEQAKMREIAMQTLQGRNQK